MIDDGMVTLNGVRYRLDDAIAWGLYSPQGGDITPDEGASEGEEGPVTAAAPAPENKETQPRARPTAKE